jgi:hypothetical protein
MKSKANSIEFAKAFMSSHMKVNEESGRKIKHVCDYLNPNCITGVNILSAIINGYAFEETKNHDESKSKTSARQ